MFRVSGGIRANQDASGWRSHGTDLEVEDSERKLQIQIQSGHVVMELGRVIARPVAADVDLVVQQTAADAEVPRGIPFISDCALADAAREIVVVDVERAQEHPDRRAPGEL